MECFKAQRDNRKQLLVYNDANLNELCQMFVL